MKQILPRIRIARENLFSKYYKERIKGLLLDASTLTILPFKLNAGARV